MPVVATADATLVGTVKHLEVGIVKSAIIAGGALVIGLAIGLYGSYRVHEKSSQFAFENRLNYQMTILRLLKEGNVVGAIASLEQSIDCELDIYEHKLSDDWSQWEFSDTLISEGEAFRADGRNCSDIFERPLH